jgi:hypothetical protein
MKLRILVLFLSSAVFGVPAVWGEPMPASVVIRFFDGPGEVLGVVPGAQAPGDVTEWNAVTVDFINKALESGVRLQYARVTGKVVEIGKWKDGFRMHVKDTVVDFRGLQIHFTVWIEFTADKVVSLAKVPIGTEVSATGIVTQSEMTLDGKQAWLHMTLERGNVEVPPVP